MRDPSDHPMLANDRAPSGPIRHGAYICVPQVHGAANPAVDALAEGLGLVNEAFAVESQGQLAGGALAGGPAAASVAFLRRLTVRPGAVDDDGLMGARAIVHVAAPEPEVVSTFCRSLVDLLAPQQLRILGGALLPMNYTGNRMYDFAYAHRVLQRPAAEAPNAFLVPLNKIAAWWQKSWMERHTYFLPRYDPDGRLVAEGHALAAEGGIPYLMRRSYRQLEEPALPGVYDFVNYFECADPHIEHFEATCAALRDIRRNPEWAYVREGPTWHGRRVTTWTELFE